MTDTLSAPLRWASYLVAPWWGGDAEPGPAEVDAEAIVALLRRNGVPLLSLTADDRPTGRALLATPAFAAALAQDRASLTRQEAAFDEIAARWRAAGIPALFVKALGPRPTFTYTSSNLDILAPHAQQDAARKIVRDLGYVELRHIEEPNKFLFRRFHAGEIAFDLHVHGQLEWTVVFLDAAEVWQHSQQPADTALGAVPAAIDGILITLAHAIYENKRLKLGELAKVLHALTHGPVDWPRGIEMARRKGWLPGLWLGLTLCDRLEAALYGTHTLPGDLRERAWRELPLYLKTYVEKELIALRDAPIRISFLLSKRMFYEKMWADATLPRPARLRNIIFHTLAGTRLRLRLRGQRPLLIALDGLDGCGKSLQAQMLSQALTRTAIRHRIVWSRGGSSAGLQPLLRLGKRLLRGQSAAAAAPTDRESARAAAFSHPLARRAWPWLIALELSLRYAATIGWPLLRGEVVIADRYLLSALAELGARLGRPDIAQTLPGRLLRWLAPRPQRRFWLDVPVAVAAARASEPGLAHLAQQAELLPALAHTLGANRIEGTQPPDQISDALIHPVLRDYLDAHRTLVDALFWSNPRPLPAAWRTRQEHA